MFEQQPIRRQIGRSKASDKVDANTRTGPTDQEQAWVKAMNSYPMYAPKGIFRYRSHEEANDDWEKWRAETAARIARQPKVGKPNQPQIQDTTSPLRRNVKTLVQFLATALLRPQSAPDAPAMPDAEGQGSEFKPGPSPKAD